MRKHNISDYRRTVFQKKCYRSYSVSGSLHDPYALISKEKLITVRNRFVRTEIPTVSIEKILIAIKLRIGKR